MNRPTTPQQQALKNRLFLAKVETDLQKRWDTRQKHHAKSLELASALRSIDAMFAGSDLIEDNSDEELLMTELDVYFDLQDWENQHVTRS